MASGFENSFHIIFNHSRNITKNRKVLIFQLRCSISLFVAEKAGDRIEYSIYEIILM